MWNGIFFLIVFACSIRIGVLLLRPEKCYAKLTGPLLAIVICAAGIIIFRYSFDESRKFAKSVATEVQAECNRLGRCPPAIKGWEARHDMYSSQIQHGERIKWIFLYHTDGKEFWITIYRFFDIRENCMGGVGRELKC